MKPVLSRDDNGLSIGQTVNPAPTKPPNARSVSRCTFSQRAQLSNEQLTKINDVHSSFTRGLNESLGAYLRVGFQVNLCSVEQLAYSEFVQRLPDVTYAVSFQANRTSQEALLQIDLSVVFPLVDILLGGTGISSGLSREVSDIEQQIMEGLSKLILRELETAWAPFATELSVHNKLTRAQIQAFLAPNDRSLCLGFDLKLSECSGKLNLVLPAVLANNILRELFLRAARHNHLDDPAALQRLTDKLMDCIFPMELSVPSIPLPAASLTELAVDKIYNLGIPVRQPPVLAIAGRKVFEAQAVRQGACRAAQLGERLTQAARENAK